MSKENLKCLLDKIDLSYEIEVLQEVPSIVYINITTDVPLACMQMGSSIEIATEKAIKLIFLHIKTLLDV